MIYRLIAAKWAEDTLKPRVLEGEFTEEEIQNYNVCGYNIYYLPNYPRNKKSTSYVDGKDIDVFDYVFVDMDLKQEIYVNKEEFFSVLAADKIVPTKIVDSGNGVHAYWRVNNLDAMSYLRLQRRLYRYFNTDETMAKIYQLLRVPGTCNVKDMDNPKLCEIVYENNTILEAEQLDKWLPPITEEDEKYCVDHFNKTYAKEGDVKVKSELPENFLRLMSKSDEIRRLFTGQGIKDRSRADYRLAHLLAANGLTRDETMSVLINTAKASERSSVHQVNYAQGIVDKVTNFLDKKPEAQILSKSVLTILKQSLETPKNTRLPCYNWFDATEHGFRLTEVLGLIGGAGAGKTSTALNYFRGFVDLNPSFIHLFVSLEQPEGEIAHRIKCMAANNPALLDKIHILGNYNEDGTYRNLSLDNVQDYVKVLEVHLGLKVGCVVIDHIAVLKQQTKEGEAQGLIDICKAMKSFAVFTNTFLIMQSQTSREKAGIGDLELDKDAAYGTSYFEFYCDYIVTTWQPLKRVYDEAPDMTVQAFKACKIRVKDVKLDRIKEDSVYALMYEVETQELRHLTEQEMERYDFYNKKCVNLRNKDKKRDTTPIKRIVAVKEKVND